MSEARVQRLRGLLEEQGLDALLVTGRQNVRYITGFSGSNGVAVLRRDAAALVTDGRYKEQAAREAPSWETDIYQRDITDEIRVRLAGSTSVGIEDSSSIAFQSRLATALPDVELKPTSGVVEQLRALKEPDEIEAIRAAVEPAEKAWETLLPMIQPGVTERQLAAALDYRMISAGADKPAFDTVVASGPNAAMPHAKVTDRRLAEGDLIVIDFGALKNGYCCDVTRTVALGEISARAAEVLGAVRSAWDAGFASIAPGVAAADADLAARGQLERLGFGEEFVHSLGHGLGLEVHEKPTLSRLSKETLEPGMVFTIEPGVYIESEMGARHEETVLLTPDGCEILTEGIGV